MTCIATDGRTIAADGRACVGSLITTDDRVKLTRGTDGAVIGVAGEATAGVLVRQWFEKGADLGRVPAIKPPDDGEGTPFEGLILRPDGSVDYLDWNFAPVARSLPAAIGSGAEVAIGLMLAGKTPAEAVELVTTRVCSVGGTVRVATRGQDA